MSPTERVVKKKIAAVLPLLEDDDRQEYHPKNSLHDLLSVSRRLIASSPLLSTTTYAP